MQWVQSSAFAYPLLEAAHIFGIALLLGSLVVFELRVWGRGGGLDPALLARLALPVTLAGLAWRSRAGWRCSRASRPNCWRIPPSG